MWMSTPSDPPPGQPSITVGSTTATAISLSWNVSSGSVVESYEVTWEREGIRSSTTITDGSTSYTIRGLEPEANYMITVAASNGAGSAVSDPVTGTTGRAGKIMCESIRIILHTWCKQCVGECHNLFRPSSWPAECDCELNNIHHHLPLLECSQWLSGGEL